MHPATKWHASKYHRYVTSISGNRSVNWHEWHCIEMAWNGFGGRIKVESFQIAFNQKYIFILLFSSFIGTHSVLSLQELCCRTIVRRTSVYAIDTLPLPPSVKSHLKSYALTSSQCFNTLTNPKKSRCKTPTLPASTRNSCCIS